MLETLDEGGADEKATATIRKSLDVAFYAPPASDAKWNSWISRWAQQVRKERKGAGSMTALSGEMKRVNPKFVPREWMLVEAYTAADAGNDALVSKLHKLFLHPYDEGTEEETRLYYRKAPSGASSTAGTGFMS